MPQVLRFGIFSLDELLGVPSEKSKEKVPFGVFLPTQDASAPRGAKSNEGKDEDDADEKRVFTTSVCIIGPTGTGKSIFGLHMASTYVADCQAAGEKPPSVLYVSTDLTHKMALRAWENFALNYPWARKDPFDSNTKATSLRPGAEISLKMCKPTRLAKDFDFIDKQRGNVIFVDMASYTAGDDWGFLHKLLSLLPEPGKDEPRHLIVIDAIEGFEALAGEVNAFGQESTRRSRIAQVMRLIAGKCHALLVVEESTDYVKDEKLAEEFIADTVIRLDNLTTRNYERRVLKVEKVRGQSHIRGQHHYSIRSGKGSTTGSQVNPDDPEVTIHLHSKKKQKGDNDKGSGKQSYVQIFHSVHRLSRKIMEVKGKAREKLKPNTYYAAFGIKYLDNMLGGKNENTKHVKAEDEYEGCYHDTRGLPCRSTTALIGDSLTQKSTLGKVFLSRCFDSFDERLRETRKLLNDAGTEEEAARRIQALLRRKIDLLADTDRPVEKQWEDEARTHYTQRDWERIAKHIRDKTGPEAAPFPWFRSRTEELIHLLGKVQFIQLGTDGQLTRVWEKATSNPPPTDREVRQLDSKVRRLIGQRKLRSTLNEARLTHLAGWLLDYKAGAAVMLGTHNTHHEQLAKEFIGWLHSKAELEELNGDMQGYQRALENYIKGGTICRRLEIHSLSSEVLIHMVQQITKSAQGKLLTRKEMESDEIRYEQSWPIRVVIDDFSTFRDIFPELREDPLLLPSVLFHFEREGVTTLIVDTQYGKPDTPIAERFESELRKMVHHNLYTWRVPFYGESRVAITAIPPLSSDYAGIVRELRWESESYIHENTASARDRATVDPHFELYTGLEEGDPQPVPLHARFYAETPAMQVYVDLENRFLSERFVSYRDPSQTAVPCVIFGMPHGSYDEVRDLAYLQRDTRLDHTFLFQVDEFWTMRKPSQHKRAGAFHQQWSYLDAITAEAPKPKPGVKPKHEDYEIDRNADPYELFQLRQGDPPPSPFKETSSDKGDPPISTELRRRDFYKTYYRDFKDYEKFDSGQRGELFIDRVPFSWDFGFLLCQKEAWLTSRTFWVKQDGKKVSHDVRTVWNSLTKAERDDKQEAAEGKEQDDAATKGKRLPYVSWRVFIEACKKAAEKQSDEQSKQVTAFDFAQISPESFSCLVLEVWLSEIYDSLKQKIRKAKKGSTKEKKLQRELVNLREAVSKRSLFIRASERKNEKEKYQNEPRTDTLLWLTKEYGLELYKSWLLLIEVLNFSDIIGETTPFNFDFKSKNTDFSAIASKHWYKTGSQCPDEIAALAPLVAVRLPGHFSVRGDWFLAVAGGSRSSRQAERALDLLNSRRSNVMRLQLGVGLPTRVPDKKPDSPERKSSLGLLRTKLISHERGQHNMDYETFLKIAAPGRKGDDFHWLWRSGLRDYAHSNRIWHTWLNRTLLWWHRKLLRYKSVWVNSFKVYDNLTNNPPLRPTLEDFAPRYSKLREIEQELRGKKSAEAKQVCLKKHLKEYKAVYMLAQLKVRSGFRELWEELKEELQEADEVSRELEQDPIRR